MICFIACHTSGKGEPVSMTTGFRSRSNVRQKLFNVTMISSGLIDVPKVKRSGEKHDGNSRKRREREKIKEKEEGREGNKQGELTWTSE